MTTNVLGTALSACCFSPKTGYYRDGYCQTSAMDMGSHVLCAQVTQAFLQYSLSMGNDLMTAHPDWDFPGLVEGDFWCLCAMRWLEAEQAGVAPKLKLSACHARALEFAPLELFLRYALPEL